MPSSKEQKSNEMESMMVYCRLKPTYLPTEKRCIRIISEKIVRLTIPKNLYKEFIFKRIFMETSTQKEIFDEVALPLVHQLVKGKNSLLFTYGVTGSGKTYTMTGNRQRAGIMQRCLDVLFNSINDFQAARFVFKLNKANGFELQTEKNAELEREEWNLKNTNKFQTKESQEDLLSVQSKDSTKIIIPQKNHAYAVFISYIEVYNNYVYDLLDHLSDASMYSRPQPKPLREDNSGNMYIHGISEIEVKSTEEAYETFRKGQRRKRMAHTALNADSSRSHSIFTIRLVQAPFNVNGKTVVGDGTQINVSQLSLVDLAGSERTSRTNNTGQRLCEAGKINQSLMALRKCLELLRENQITGMNHMIPYREQKITMLFKNFFEGGGNIRMVLCVNPSISDAEENSLILQFAELSQDITTKSSDSKVDNDKLKNSTDALKDGKGTYNKRKERNLKDLQSFYNLGKFPNAADYLCEEDFRRKLIEYLKERIIKIEELKTEVAVKSKK